MVRISKHVSYSNVMSTVAVFLAIGGGSVAIASVPNDSVGSAKVIDESLKSKDLKDGEAVESSDVVDEELGASDIASSGVTASEIATAAVQQGEVDTDAITQSEIRANAVDSTEIVDGSINASEVGAGNIYRGDVEEVTFEEDNNARNGDYGLDEVSADCSTRENSGELISADVKWANLDPQEDEVFISEIKLNMNTNTATAVGGSDMGSQGGDSFVTLQVSAVCLAY